MSPLAKLRVYTDGGCSFCLWASGLVERKDREHRLDFRDFNVSGIASETPFSTATLSRRMHVQMPDGSWHVGYWGWIAVLEALPSYRWLGRILRWIPFRWVGPYFYDFVAKNRYRVPAPLLRTLGVPQPCSDVCSLPSPDDEP